MVRFFRGSTSPGDTTDVVSGREANSISVQRNTESAKTVNKEHYRTKKARGSVLTRSSSSTSTFTIGCRSSCLWRRKMAHKRKKPGGESTPESMGMSQETDPPSPFQATPSQKSTVLSDKSNNKNKILKRSRLSKKTGPKNTDIHDKPS